MPSGSARSASDQVRAVGNLKFDVPPPGARAGGAQAFEAATDGRRIFVAASTHEGEETIVAEAHRRVAGRHPGLLTVIDAASSAARPAIRDALAAAGLSVALRSLGDAHPRNRHLCRGHARRTRPLLPRRRCRAGQRHAGADRRPQPDRGGPARHRHPARAACRDIAAEIYAALDGGTGWPPSPMPPASRRGARRPARRFPSRPPALADRAEAALARSQAPSTRRLRRSALSDADGDGGDARPARGPCGFARLVRGRDRRTALLVAAWARAGGAPLAPTAALPSRPSPGAACAVRRSIAPPSPCSASAISSSAAPADAGRAGAGGHRQGLGRGRSYDAGLWRQPRDRPSRRSRPRHGGVHRRRGAAARRKGGRCAVAADRPRGARCSRPKASTASSWMTASRIRRSPGFLAGRRRWPGRHRRRHGDAGGAAPRARLHPDAARRCGARRRRRRGRRQDGAARGAGRPRTAPRPARAG